MARVDKYVGRSSIYRPFNLDDKEQAKRFWEAFQWKWEFLRRNEQYVTDFKNKCTPRNDLYDVIGEINAPYGPKDIAFAIAHPINPDFEYEAIKKLHDASEKKPVMQLSFLEVVGLQAAEQGATRNIPFYQPILWHGVEKEGISFILDKKGKPAYMRGTWPITEEEVSNADLNEICFRINLNAPTERIIGDFEKHIRVWRNLKKSKRPNYSIYKRYIRMLDLKKEGKTKLEIAKIIYPKRVRVKIRNKYDNSSVLEKVQKDLKSAKAFVNGGFIEIV